MPYTDDEIILTLRNVANDKEGLKFIEILLDKLGAFERGCNFQNHEVEMFNRGKREQGLWLLDLLTESNFEKFVELQKRRRNLLCQKLNKKQTQD